MKNPQLVWMINGQGFGNSTRCLAVMQALPNNYHHAVITSRPADQFWQNRVAPEALLVLTQARYARTARGHLDAWGSLRNGLTLPAIALSQRRSIMHWLQHRPPDLVISDSHYAGPWKPFHLALNSAAQVLSACLRPSLFPLRQAPQLLVELLDALYHRLVPDEVLAPWFQGPIGLMCRPEFRQPCPQGHRLIMLVSGSGMATLPAANGWGLGRLLEVVGANGEDGPEVRFHGQLDNPVGLLREAEVLIVQGGLSSISEAIALRKPCLVWPLEGHAEQLVNAREFCRLGVARMVHSPEELRRQLPELLEERQQIERHYQRLDDLCQGAVRAASRIRHILENGTA